jgi:alanine racemase
VLHRVCASINRRALQHNLAVARAHAHTTKKGGKLLAVIKANAYGHGLVPVAEALEAADMYGVTDIHEAERLRAAGTHKDILILQGLISIDDVARVGAGGFQVVIHRLQDLQWLESEFDRKPPRQPLTFWLKLQSGMGRLGIAPSEYAACYRALEAKPWAGTVIMMTHLANASLPDSALNNTQLQCFRQIEASLRDLAPATSIPSSSGLLLDIETHSTWVRPGIMLYGSSPFGWSDVGRRREKFGLQAVMTLQARLISIENFATGHNIGYNSQFVCPKPMRIGIASIGYADGYPSHTPNGAPVEICGKRSCTVGRVSMDMLTVDLSEIPEAQLGDAVTLWGDTVSIDEVAAHTGVISYNLTCSISARVPFLYN